MKLINFRAYPEVNVRAWKAMLNDIFPEGLPLRAQWHNPAEILAVLNRIAAAALLLLLLFANPLKLAAPTGAVFSLNGYSVKREAPTGGTVRASRSVGVLVQPLTSFGT